MSTEPQTSRVEDTFAMNVDAEEQFADYMYAFVLVFLFITIAVMVGAGGIYI